MRFADIRGQQAAVGTLQRALANKKVPHAYLFSGISGVGKRQTALALARALNCADASDDACGACLSCRKIAKGTHPDVSVLTLAEGKKLIPIDSVRRLERKLCSQPYEGRANVAIIDPADMMSDQAANALLKTLEEPRPGSFLILVSARSTALLSTVRSRCQTVRFRPLSQPVVAGLLEDQGVDSDAAALVAALCGGSLDQASAYLDEDLAERTAAVFGLIAGVQDNTPQKGLLVAQDLRADRIGALAVLDLLTLILNEILWLAGRPDEEPGDRILVRRFGDPLVRASRELTPARAAAFILEATRAVDKVKYFSANPQLAIESMVMAMRHRASTVPGAR